MNNKNNLIIIAGPTAVGKTDISIKLAQLFNTVIVSADSRQMYRELNIGTAKPSLDQLNAVNHYFINNLSVVDYFNASMYEMEAMSLLSSLFEKHHNVILTGGTGLYIDALCKGIDNLPTVDPDIRNSLIEKHKNEGLESLRFQLKLLDPEYYAKVDLKNPTRILKALEVSMMTGKPYSTFLTNSNRQRPFNIVKLCLTRDRAELFERINRRVDIMIEQGLLDEVKAIVEFRNLNSLKTVGYRELFDFIDGNISLETAIELIKRNTRHYAKRQMTWFGRTADEYKNIEAENFDEIKNYIDDIIIKNG